MIGLLQRVSAADVRVGGEVIAAIDRGMVVLVGVEKGDSEASAERLAERLLGYRIFPDAEQRMNLSLRDIKGEILLVPQFTLAADTTKGTRPGFSRAAPPEKGERLFDHLCRYTAGIHSAVQTGQFGAEMRVSLINDGPVTFWLQV